MCGIAFLCGTTLVVDCERFERICSLYLQGIGLSENAATKPNRNSVDYD